MKEKFKTLVQGREIYLWGARQLGVSMCSSLRRQGFEPAGFLDSSPDIQGTRQMGLPVLNPTEILSRPRGSFYNLICSSFFVQEIG